MKKQLILTILLVLLSVIPVQALIIDTRDIPLTKCCPHWGCIDAAYEYEWSKNAWDNKFATQQKWAPDQAGLQIDASGIRPRIVVRFQLSWRDLNSFKDLYFDNTDTRWPSALELDVVDFLSLFGNVGKTDFSIRSNLPDDALLDIDVSDYDSEKQLSVIIFRPDKLKAYKLYQIEFFPEILSVDLYGHYGKFRMSWQVSMNYKWIAAMRNGESTNCDILSLIDYLKDEVVDSGNTDIGPTLVTDYWNTYIPKAARHGWYYFTVSTDQTDKHPQGYNNYYMFEKDTIQNIVCWDDKQNPEHNSESTDYCQGLFDAPLGKYYRYDKSNNSGGSDNANGNNPNNRDPPPEQEVINDGTPRNNGDPDMKISTVTLSKGANSTRHHELEQDPEEKFYAYAQIKNIGTARAKDFKVKFYIDGGKKNFNRDNEDYQGSVRIEEFNSGAEIRYNRELTSPTEPGTYWVYACITSIDEDSDMGNNCSDEDDKEEYGKLIIVEPPPVPSDLTAHSLRLKSGETTLPGGRSFGFTVTVNNIGAGDAESNFQILYEKNGPSTGYVWKPLGESRFSAVPLYAGSSEEHSTFNELAAAPTEDGDYLIRSCVDSGGVISESNEGNNCSEELEIEVLPSLDPSLNPVYRFYSEVNTAHFFTISEAEKNTVIDTYPTEIWKYERIGFCAHTSQVDDSLPVYRFYSDANTAHFFTISETEKNNIINTYPEDIWRYERVGWYAYNYPKAGTVPVYRFYSDSNRAHFYTVFESEKQYIEDNYPDDVWRYEHVGWWTYPCP